MAARQKRKRKKHWSKVIEEAGVEVRIYERSGSSRIWRSVVVAGEKDRASLKTADRELAEERARAFARELAKRQLTGVTPDDVTLGQVFEVYRRERLPQLKGQHQRSVKTRLRVFEEAWGADLRMAEFCQTHVDAYTAGRTSGKLSPLRGSKERGGRKPRPVRMGAVEGEFRTLSAVFNFATAHKVGDHYLLRENPLHRVKRPKAGKGDVRRPVASHQRYTATQEHTDTVDPAGRLRCILALARHTGRRESAICGLQASDLLLSEGRVRAALAGAGLDEAIQTPEGQPLYPHGAIHWSADLDKQKRVHITPITGETRRELDRYLRKSPRVGDAPLFPAAEDDSAPIRRDVAARWLLKAEKLAELPKLKGGVYHPYRRLWASERQHLSDVAVAKAGGWSDTQALKLCYQHARPADILMAVQGGGR